MKLRASRFLGMGEMLRAICISVVSGIEVG